MDKKWWTLLVVCVGTFMLLLDVSAVNVAIPSIERGLHASLGQIQWMLDAYTLGVASLMLTTGVLGDRYGRRLVFTAGLIVFTISSILCGLAQWPMMVVAARAFQGVGGAMMYATSLALIAHRFQGRERGVAFAVWGTLTGVAIALGPVIGGVITTLISWRAIFLVNVPIGLAAIVGCLRVIEESRTPEPHPPDVPGFVSMTLCLFALAYGLIRAGEVGWQAGSVTISFIVAAAMLVVFVVRETHTEHPMFDFSLFKIPTVTGGLVSGFSMNGSLFSVNVYLILYLQEDRGYSAMQTGVRMLVPAAAMLLPRIASGRVTGRVPVRWLVGPGLLLIGIGLLLMSELGPRTPWTHLLPGWILAGIGSGLVNPALASTAVGVVETERAGMASGMNSTFRQMGTATAIAAYGTLLASSLHQHLVKLLAATPGLAARSETIATAVRDGGGPRLIAAASPHVRAHLANVISSSFTSSLHMLFLVAGGVALVGSASAFLLVRPQDFHAHHRASSPAAPSQPTEEIELSAGPSAVPERATTG